MQLKIHPLFFVLAITLIAFGQALDLAWTFVALFLHELAHAAMARLRGFVVKKLVLTPFGAMMSVDECFDRQSSALVGAAGPVCNLVVALSVLGIWWLFPSVYAYTEAFFYANLTLGIFNLLPVYPLDGSRIVLGAVKNRLKAIKGLQIAGIIVSFAFFGAFILSAFYRINFSLGIIAVFLFYGAAFASNDEMYISVLDSAAKKFELGVEKKRVAISSSAPIVRFYHHVSGQSDTVFEVLHNGEVAAEIDERKLKEIAIKNKLSSSIGSALGIADDAPKAAISNRSHRRKPYPLLRKSK